jgi:hypothetical protein
LIPPLLLFAQIPEQPTLKEQLEAQYPPGTVLTIQKQGILAFALSSTKICPAKYQNNNLKPPEGSCTLPLKGLSRLLTVGEKVHPSEIQVNLPLEQISFWIIECDLCNKEIPSSSYKAQIEFQFAKGYIEKGGIPEIEDTISQVLSFDDSGDQSAQSTGEVLTNNDVLKMVKAKLGDGIVISTVKSSVCDFDTSVSGMVKLKQAGVSDVVIQAMRDAKDAAKNATNESGPTDPVDPPQDPASAPAPVPGQVSFSVRHRHSVFWNTGTSEVEYFCSGTLSVSVDGTVSYSCTQTDDPSGRCENVSLSPGSLKEVKVGLGGNLHIVTKTQGKFDFYGDRKDIYQAQAAIAPLIRK